MSRDQTYGALILLVSIVAFVLYAWLLYLFAILILQITAFVPVAGVLVVLGWISWTMATTPRPKPLDLETSTKETNSSTAKDPM